MRILGVVHTGLPRRLRDRGNLAALPVLLAIDRDGCYADADKCRRYNANDEDGT